MNQIENTINQISSWHQSFLSAYPDINKIAAASLGTIDQLKNFLFQADEGIDEEIEFFQRQKVKFEYAEEAKQLAILYRDITFQLFKASFINKGIVQESRIQFFSISESALDSNVGQLKDIQETNTSDIKQIKKWKHYLSPITKIVEQLDELSAQIRTTLKANAELENLSRDITFYEIAINQVLEKHIEFTRELKSKISNLTNKIHEETVDEDFSVFLKSTVKQLNEFLTTNKIPDLYYSREFKIKVPIKLLESRIEVKEMDFKRQINFWLDGHVMPKLISGHQLSNQIFQKSLLTLSSIEGQIHPDYLASKVNDVADWKRINETLQNLLEYLKNQLAKLKVEEDELLIYVKNNLSLKNIFREDKFFLYEPNQLVFKEYGDSTRNFILNKPIERVKAWYSQLSNNYLFFDNKSTNRKATFDFINNTLVGNELGESSNAFFLKGYLSDSFIIKRVEVNNRINDSIKLWKNGYQGSTLIYGDYLSGRSTMLGAIANAHLGTVIKLVPYTAVSYQNNKFDTTGSITNALESIHRLMREDDRLIVLIDDLELWRDKSQTAFANIQMLQKAIQDFGRKMYFIIATNHWYKDYLDTYFMFSDLFAEVINISKMEKDLLVSAVLKRHLATTEERAVDKKEYEFQEQEWKDRIQKISNFRDFNIGACLQEWYLQTNKNKDQIDILLPPLSFSKLVDKYQIILLYILKFNQISEQEINLELGATNVRSLKEDIRQLMGKKIIERDVKGRLKLNEQIVYHVEKSLNKILYLTN